MTLSDRITDATIYYWLFLLPNTLHVEHRVVCMPWNGTMTFSASVKYKQCEKNETLLFSNLSVQTEAGGLDVFDRCRAYVTTETVWGMLSGPHL